MHSEKLQAAIKKVMKVQGKNLYDLAEFLEVSYATAKRVLSGELTLSRMLQICDWLGVRLGELEVVAEEEARERGGVFTASQEEFLGGDSRYLSYLIYLYAGDNPKKIATENGLTSQSTERYLRKLERYDLIRINAKGNVQLPYAELPRFMGAGGVLWDVYNSAIFNKVSEFYRRTHKVGGKARMSFDCKKLSSKSYEKMSEEMDAFIQKWKDIADVEQKTRPASELVNAGMMVCRSFTTNDDDVKEIKNMFGAVINL
ncbi:MAG: helix-turn-helix domain-containing protein [Oligoflexales bacterium]